MLLIVALTACTDSFTPYFFARHQPVTIYVDRRFDAAQRADIQAAFDAWTRASNGAVVFDVHWNAWMPYPYYRDKAPADNQGIYLWHLDIFTGGDVTASMEQKLLRNRTNGFYVPGETPNSANVVVVTDYTSRHHFYQVVTHELGHLLGLQHINRPDAIMSPHASGTCISKWDLAELCSLYGCSPVKHCVPILPDRKWSR